MIIVAAVIALIVRLLSHAALLLTRNLLDRKGKDCYMPPNLTLTSYVLDL